MVEAISNLRGPGRSTSTSKTLGSDGSKANAGTAPGEATVQISGDAAALSSLYETASAFVQQSSLKPLTGTSTDDPRCYYLNIEKFNDHIFDQAASSMVGEANKIGISLSKDDVIKQLRDANIDISSYKIDMQDRDSKLTPDNLLKYVTRSDLDNITDFYIASKKEGLPEIATLSYAVNIGTAGQSKALGIKLGSAEDFLITDDTTPPGGIPDSVREGAKKLYGHLGLSNMTVNLLAAGYTGPDDSTGRTQAFQFLLQMLRTDYGSTAKP